MTTSGAAMGDGGTYMPGTGVGRELEADGGR
jgi:hypothetical protein